MFFTGNDLRVLQTEFYYDCTDVFSSCRCLVHPFWGDIVLFTYRLLKIRRFELVFIEIVRFVWSRTQSPYHTHACECTVIAYVDVDGRVSLVTRSCWKNVRNSSFTVSHSSPTDILINCYTVSKSLHRNFATWGLFSWIQTDWKLRIAY